MKKARCIILLSILLCSAFIPCAAFAAGGVPEAVLDLRRSVVRVLCQASDGRYTGSGFAIGTEEPIQYIVTNLHVVDANVNGVTILRENNREIPAKVYLQIEHADLCVLLLDEALYGVPPVTLQDSKEVTVGQAVYALGFPGAADKLFDKTKGSPDDVTITDGIVSALKTFTYPGQEQPAAILQINAAINHGNSGGPLVDEQARVLGVNSLGAGVAMEAESINGAIAIQDLAETLRERGIAYLSASDEKAFPLMTVVITSASVLAVAAALLAILLVRRARKKRTATQPLPATGTPLPEYLKQWGGRLPYDMATRVLVPVLRNLAALHAAGRIHGDICPENISVDPNSVQAALRAPEFSAQGGRLVLRPGFSAPEQYRADGRLGLWTDVYSMCALLYFIITGNAPRGVMERMAQGGESFDHDAAGIGEAQAAVLFAGLALDAAARPQNAAELAAALHIDLEEIAPAVPAIAEPAAAKPAKKRMKTGKKVLIACLATLFVLCAGVGGYYLYLDNKYNAAIECIQKQDYKGAIDNLTNVLRIFKSTEQWMKYASAGYALQENDFHSARLWFTELADFQKSNEMLKEVDYLEAYYLLSSGDYQRAQLVFTSLEDYKKSKEMLLETDYQNGLFLMSTKEYDKAKNLFLSLIDYKDSKTMVMESDYQIAFMYMEGSNFVEAINILTDLAKKKYSNSDQLLLEAFYCRAIQLFERQQYSEALKNFEEINSYKEASSYIVKSVDIIFINSVTLYREQNYSESKKNFTKISKYINCDGYFTLIEAHTFTDFKLYDWEDIQNLDFSYSSLKRVYQKLTSLGSYEDAQSLRINDIFIYFRLEGSWRGGGYYFKLYRKSNGWSTEYDLPWYKGDNFTIENSIYLTGSSAKMTKKQFSFYFISENKMELYCYKNRRTYTLTR